MTFARRTGAVQWSRMLGHGIRQRLRVPSALLEFEGGLVAGLEDETLVRFRASGEEVWHAQSQYHAVTTLGAIEIGGQPHILVGSEYYALNLFDEKGTMLWLLRLGPATALSAADLDGNGQKEIQYAEWTGIHAVRARDASVMWSVNMGGETLGVAPVSGAVNVGVASASDAGQVAVVTVDGNPKWRLDSGESLTSMAVSGEHMALGCLSGRVQLRRLDDGRLESITEVGSAVLKLAPLREGFAGAAERGVLFAL